MEIIAILTVAAAVIGLVAAVGLASWIKKADEGNDRMKEIGEDLRRAVEEKKSRKRTARPLDEKDELRRLLDKYF